MKKFKKEIIAIASGMAFAYNWQLFALLTCYISDPNGNFITRDMFIPSSTIQLIATPMVAWVLMGLFRVTWFEKWVRITMCVVAFLIPFILITGVTVIAEPSLWWKPMYWVANVAISALLTFTMFKPLLQFRYSDVEQDLPKANKKVNILKGSNKLKSNNPQIKFADCYFL